MDRKQFLSSLVVLGAAPAAPAQETPAAAPDPREKFKQNWIASLMANMDGQMDPAQRTKLMEACGRACAQRGAVQGLGKAAGGDVDKLLQALGSHLGPQNATRAGNVAHLRYPKCYCPLVGSGPDRLSATWCECSKGWVLEVFGQVTGKPVTAELKSSIKRGDPECHFEIRLG
jgi:hypothetical protein